MMRLTKVELRRLFSRRLTTIALLGALVITGLMLFFAYQGAKPLSAAEVTSNRTQFDSAHQEWVTNGDQQMADCLKAQSDAKKADPNANFRCDSMEPKLEDWGRQPAKFAELMPGALMSWSYVLAAVAFLVGAGFVSAEFSSGSMANWLTFQPRRMRVYASKLGAAGLGLFPVAVALLGLLTGGVWLIVRHFSPTAVTTAKVWGDLGWMGGRAVALTLVAALAGAALGTLLRHTAAVIGVALGYLILAEAVFGSALKAAQPWLLGSNIMGWLQHGTTYFIDSCKNDAQGNYVCQSVDKVISFGHSTAYLGLLVVLVVALAALVFRRRDVN